MFLGAGSRSKTSVRQKLVLRLASSLTNTTPSDGSVSASKLAASALGSGVTMINGTFQASVAASALTVALKTLAGVDPTSTDPIYLVFRNSTAATGDYTVITVTSALSLTISSGSTLGTVNSQAFRLWLVCFNDAGTPRLALINCLNPNPWNIYPLGQFPIASSTAEGGAGAADSVWVFYTGTAVASKAYIVLGYMTWESGLATAGTWSAGPTRLHLFLPGTPLPGALISLVEQRTGAVATGSTTIPDDDTIPQSTEGDQYMTQSITPTSAANVLMVQANADLANSGAVSMYRALFQDAVANALVAGRHGNWSANIDGSEHTLDWTMLAATTSSTALKFRAGGSGAGTTTFNGSAGARKFGGVLGSFLRVTELMA